MDFVGLGFATKKEGRTLPAGLVPIADDFAQGNLPEVEIIVGDSSNFGAATPKPQGDDPLDLYKPKVSSWGVFPRPNDISKTEEKAAKKERTRQLVAAYNTKMGLNIDPKLRLDSEKTLKDGDSLMNVGKLKEALPYYEKVMDKLPFKVMLLAHV
ncbi:hypothetical protein RchiOBHm_Chr4g0400611 [Rosa chinensis]|uniref:Uncharacterized protein n=1 Tax=Rosa chinensis TaxID=74649 RepID=A0A2P6QSW8_ROSCH|nr:hypothetical protein RchiOBHm_Chr4g0400611 [Rosa chinensis]